MPRKPRIEIAGGLYHVIARGNNRRKIFRSHEDYLRFTSILAQQKLKLPFYLYAYCLMPNHVHLLIEMQDDAISRIMQRVLTSYSQYHNRKYKKIGHLFQGRYKSILCQTDRYLGELVRYNHLNPVRARMVKRPEDYEYSGHRAYLGLDKTGLVDAEPVLRHFGASRKRAVEAYIQFVESSLGEKSQDDYYRATEGRLLVALLRPVRKQRAQRPQLLRPTFGQSGDARRHVRPPNNRHNDCNAPARDPLPRCRC